MSKLPEQDEKKSQPKPEEPDAEDAGMTLWEHLDELRSRLIKMILVFMIGFGVAWGYKRELLVIVTEPFLRAWKEGGHAGTAALYSPDPAAAFFAYVRLAALSGFVFSLPIMLYQVWAFIAPGLYSKEKRYAIPFVVSSCLLFVGGGYFGWRLAFPIAFKFLLSFNETIGELALKENWMMGTYLDFVIRMLLAFGLAAELPILAFFLAVAGIVNYRHLIKFFRYFLVIDFIIAAIVTPPDVMSQLLLAIPLAFLYIIGIGVAWVFGKRPPPEVKV
jgi:sec-independent protein translocase protein TatC